MRSKILVRLFFVLLIFIPIVPGAGAETPGGIFPTDPPATISPSIDSAAGALFIAADPADVFPAGGKVTLNGETNLPPGEKIDYSVSTGFFSPGGPKFDNPANASGTTSVSRGISGNTWSFTIDTDKFRTGKYIAELGSERFPGVNTSFFFYLQKNPDSTEPTDASPTGMVYTSPDYWITIDPVGTHAIGDIFSINGTTNLPAQENLTMVIGSAFRHMMKNTPPVPYYSVRINNITVFSADAAQGGINRWSANVSDLIKELPRDNYDVFVASSSVNLYAVTQSSVVNGTGFSLLPATNVTPFPGIPTTNSDVSDIQSGISATGTTIVPPSGKVSPLSPALPCGVLAAMMIFFSLHRKKI